MKTRIKLTISVDEIRNNELIEKVLSITFSSFNMEKLLHIVI